LQLLCKSETDKEDFIANATITSLEVKLFAKMNELLRKFDQEVPLHGDEKIVMNWRQELENILMQLKLSIMVSKEVF